MMPLSSWFCSIAAPQCVRRRCRSIHDGEALLCREDPGRRLSCFAVFGPSMNTCPTSMPLVSFSVPSFLVTDLLRRHCGDRQTVQPEVTIPVRIDIVRIILIAADDHVAQRLDRVVGDNPDVFRPTGPANPTGAPVICSTTVGVASSRSVTRRSR